MQNLSTFMWRKIEPKSTFVEPWILTCFPIPISTRQICQFFPHVVFCRTIKIKNWLVAVIIARRWKKYRLSEDTWQCPKRQRDQLLQLIQRTIGQTLAYKCEPNFSHKTFMNLSTKLVYQLSLNFHPSFVSLLFKWRALSFAIKTKSFIG